MREYVLVTTADVPAEALWRVAADAATDDWGVCEVEESRPPSRVVSIARRFLARVRTSYEFESAARGTRLRVTVQLLGPLGFAYRRSFDRAQQDTLFSRVAGLVERAKRGQPGRP